MLETQSLAAGSSSLVQQQQHHKQQQLQRSQPNRRLVLGPASLGSLGRGLPPRAASACQRRSAVISSGDEKPLTRYGAPGVVASPTRSRGTRSGCRRSIGALRRAPTLAAVTWRRISTLEPSSWRRASAFTPNSKTSASDDDGVGASADAASPLESSDIDQFSSNGQGSGVSRLHHDELLPEDATSPPPEKGVPHRWRVIAMMALSFILCNMDKVNMSVAVIPMASELGWSATDRGLVSSAFFWGYSLTQVPAGWLSTRIGGSKILFTGVALWSVGTLIAPPAAKLSLLALCATRVFVGLGEGLAPSSVTNIMAQLVPERERARAVTTVFGGLDVGSAVGLLLCGPLIRMYGWPIVFYAFAALGIVWCVFWPAVKPEQPDEDISRQLAAESDESAAFNGESVPWSDFLRVPAVWAIICAHFCKNWGYYSLLAWLPSYFEMALGLNVAESAFLTLVPYISTTAMTVLVGPAADTLVQRGWSVTSVRKLAQGVAFAGPAACMLACARLTPPCLAGGAAVAATAPTITFAIVAILSLAFGLGAWARAGLYCNHQDISPKYAGALLGLSNTAGALPGVLGVTATGYLLDVTGSWAMALFLPAAMFQVVGLLVYTAFASSQRINFTNSRRARLAPTT